MTLFTGDDDLDPPLRFLISLLAGVGFYALWYRINVAPWCPAMWGGTAPPLIIGTAGLMVYRLFAIVYALRNRKRDDQ